jgi:hypothetical protein
MSITLTYFTFVIIAIFAYVFTVQTVKQPVVYRNSLLDEDAYQRRVEPYGTYSFGDFFTTPQAMMPGYFEGTRVRCTDGCMYRTSNKGVYVDNACAQMCMNSDSELAFNEYVSDLTNSINDKAVVYDHS